jgi:hypothetical protein
MGKNINLADRLHCLHVIASKIYALKNLLFCSNCRAKAGFLLLVFFVEFANAQTEKPLTISSSATQNFFNEETSVELKASNPEAKIVFTLNGSQPTKYSQKYTQPLRIKTTTPIRAMAFIENQTVEFYQTIFIATNHKLPVASIITRPEYFWDTISGIYTKGCCASEHPPFKGANYWQDKEVKINIEYFTEEKKQVINQEAGLKIFGGWSRSLAQKSFAIYARKKYSNSKFNHPFFKNKAHIEKYNSLVLRNSGGDFNKTQMRDVLMTNISESAGLVVQASQAVAVYINGEYWGIYNLREKINEHFIKANFGVDKDSVDMMRHRMDVQKGSSKEYQSLLDFLKKNKFSSNENIRELSNKMNIDNYITHNLCQVYFDNQDYSGNVRFWRKHGENNQWNWILYDTDFGFGVSDPKAYVNNTLDSMTTYTENLWPYPHWSTFIIRKLLENDSIQHQYCLRAFDLLNTSFSSKVVLKKIDSIQAIFRHDMQFHTKRWGGSVERWEKNVNILRQFATLRPKYFREHLMNKFGYKDTCVILVKTPSNQGLVNLNTLTEITDFKGVYAIGQTIYAEAVPKRDFDFVGWKNRTETTPKIAITLTGNTTLEPIFKQKPPSAWNNAIIITELKIKSADKSPDWIELYNHTNQPIHLSGWKLFSERSQRMFKLPDTTIKANSYLVVHLDKSCNIKPKNESVVLYDEHNQRVCFMVIDVKKTSELEDIVLSIKSPHHHPEQASSWLLNYGEPTPSLPNTFFETILAENKHKKQLMLWFGSAVALCGLVLLVFSALPKKKVTVS